MQGQMAAAHPFRLDTKTGIVFHPREVKLLEDGTVLAKATHKSPTAWDYWHNLEFVENFPQISHWYFGSFWTGRVRVSAPITAIEEDETVMGYMQFVDEQTEGQAYSVSASEPVTVFTPLPPFETDFSNLPLRLALAEKVIGVVQGDVTPDKWQVVTSLVERGKLADCLSAKRLWQLEQTPSNLRFSLCGLLGLEKED
jgi:hypothetical protein